MIFTFSILLLEEVVYRQADEDDRQNDREVENLFLHAPLGGIGAAGLSERAAEAAAAPLLQKHQTDDACRNYDLNDGDKISHRIEFNNKIITVAARSGPMPAMVNSGISALASQTIDISITKLNRFKVKTRRGMERIFKIGATVKFSKAMQKPAIANVGHPPE